MLWKLGSSLVTKHFAKVAVDYYHQKYTILERNFLRLSDILMENNEPTVAIFGQPGAGKSTLLHTLTEGKCNPKPFISQKTDATDWSTNPEVTLMHSYTNNGKLTHFIDTPGYGTAKHPLCSYDHFPYDEMTKIVFVIRGKVQQADEEMFSQLIMRGLSEKILLVRSLSEDLAADDRIKVKVDLNRNIRYKHVHIPLIFTSSRTGEGISSIREWLWG